MENLQDFLLLFRLTPTQEQPTTEQLHRMQQEWGLFIGGIAAQARLVSTNRLGFEGNQIDRQLAVTPGMHTTGSETISGYMVVKAPGITAATDMAKNCPVLKIGGSVEVRSIVPMNL